MPESAPHWSPSSAQPLIRASELSQYAFCRKAWWLGAMQGHRSQNVAALDRGERHHQQHGARVKHMLQRRKAGLALLAGGGCLLMVALLLTVIGALAGGG